MKEFNVEEALKGAPVVLRNGRKAMVVHRLPEDIDPNYSFIGYELDENNKFFFSRCWLYSGSFILGKECSLDIVGMWEEPRQHITIRIPQPLKAGEIMDRVGEKIFVACQPSDIYIGSYIKEIEVTTEGINLYSWDLVHKGFAFATKEDAEAFLAAMKSTVGEK